MGDPADAAAAADSAPERSRSSVQLSRNTPATLPDETVETASLPPPSHSAPVKEVAQLSMHGQLTSPVAVDRTQDTDSTDNTPDAPDSTSPIAAPTSAQPAQPAQPSAALHDPALLNTEDEDDIPVSVRKYTWKPPPDVDSVPYRAHAGEGSQYLRDILLGVNDGLISTFLVVVAVVGGQSSRLQALLTGISSAIAGALSMGIGEYIATKSQLQVADGEMRLESEHFKYHRDVEIEQLRQFLTSVNLSGNLLEAVVSEVGRSDEGLMKMMQAFEFGGEEELERNPFKAMWMSGRLFFLGSLPTVIPFFIPQLSSGAALGIAAGLVGVALFIAGAYKTRTTRGNWVMDGMENLALGGFAAGVSYAVGVAFDKAASAA